MDDQVRRKSIRDCIRHFTPAWFAVVMGTGVISALFTNFPYHTGEDSLKILGLIFFLLNLLMFTTFTIISIVRYVYFRDVWSLMLYNPVQSLYLGCFPMGLSTLINVAVNLVYKDYAFGGRPFLYFIWACWWVDVAISFVCCWGLVHIMTTRQDHALDRMTAVWLLPVVTLIVGSSSGGVLATSLYELSPSYGLLTVVFSSFMVTVGLYLSLMILNIYVLRLIVYGLPSGTTIISSIMTLGPIGQAGYSILLIGQAFQAFLPLRDGNSDVLKADSTGDTINVICICIGFVLWAIATMWLFYAVLGIGEVVNKARFPFKLHFWGLIFPNGVYANLTIELSRLLDSPFFRVWGTIWSLVTMLLWAWVFWRTVTLLRWGQIFDAPCLEDNVMERERGRFGAQRVNSSDAVTALETNEGTDTGSGVGGVKRVNGDERVVGRNEGNGDATSG